MEAGYGQAPPSPPGKARGQSSRTPCHQQHSAAQALARRRRARFSANFDLQAPVSRSFRHSRDRRRVSSRGGSDRARDGRARGRQTDRPSPASNWHASSITGRPSTWTARVALATSIGICCGPTRYWTPCCACASRTLRSCPRSKAQPAASRSRQLERCSRPGSRRDHRRASRDGSCEPSLTRPRGSASTGAMLTMTVSLPI